jgi:two-component system cell cycle response regulator
VNSIKIINVRLQDHDKINAGIFNMLFRCVERARQEEEEYILTPGDTMILESKVAQIVEEIDLPELAEKVLGLKHYIDKKKIRLINLAYRDPLTGLYNRRYLDERIFDEVERAKRYNSDLSVILADIDHFKQINDNHGHQKGDIVLKTVAHIIEKTLRHNDFAARYGGEEICFILPEASREIAKQVAEKVKERVEKQVEKKTGIHITISLGVASINKKNNTPGKLIQAADHAMYCAKNAGRNRVAIDISD